MKRHADPMLKLHDELTGHVGRLHASLEMFTVESGLDADDADTPSATCSEAKDDSVACT